MTEQTFLPKGQHSLLDLATYQTWYQASIDTPEVFWKEHAQKWVSWITPPTEICSGDMTHGNVTWFQDAALNLSANCLDRHLPKRAQQVALIWEGDDPSQHCQYTYQELYEAVCRFANVLKTHGIKKQDKVCIYLPMIPEAMIAMLACARIGAVHSVVFGGFSADALKTRILDAECSLVITTTQSTRGGKPIFLKQQVDAALKEVPSVKTVIVVNRGDTTTTSFETGRDVWFHEAMQAASVDCAPETLAATDPLFILYTSGSTGKPKGILHATGGYAVHVAMSFKMIFDYREGEVFWCTADVGWVTGHSYVVYGPLMNGATILMFEGVPSYPTFSRYWELIDKYQVNIFYTAPTAIRALRREGDEWVLSTKRHSLRLLGSVGEPINPDAWQWYFDVVGDKRCPIVDTWWQTETGGIMLSAIPYVTPLKPGSAAWPFFGVKPSIVNESGEEVAPNTMGKLVITQTWPGMMQTIYGDNARFLKTYLEPFPGGYLTGDQATKDQDGYFWIAGRDDDVIKVSGHRIGSQEVESALIHHPLVSESAVVAIHDDIKGQAIHAFVALKHGQVGSDALKKELIQEVRHSIGAIAAPHAITWVDALPKTRSGKIMRRILKKIANHDTGDLGDLSTLADPDVVTALVKELEEAP